MKRYVSLILTGFIFLLHLSSYATLFFVDIKVAHASSYFLRVINDRTVFYSDANENSALFYLPYTYYVKSLGDLNGYVHVECYGTGGSPALDGYVKKQDLFDDGLTVESPYVNLSITTATTSILYADTTLSTPLQYVFAERVMRYYGNYVCQDQNVYYVEYNGKLGYVKESDVYPFAIPNHPNELTFIPKEEPSDTPNYEGEEQSGSQVQDYLSLKIIIIVCLLFAGIVALFFALKHKPNERIAASYYDENDYE